MARMKRAEIPKSAKSPKPERPTDAELDARIDLTYRLLARRYPTHKIIEMVSVFCADKQGKPAARFTVRNQYLVQARRLLRANAETAREELRAKSLAFYEDVSRDPKCPYAVQVKAMNSVDKLMGLRAPERHQHSVVTLDFTKLFSPNGANGNGRPDLIEAEIKAIEVKEV